MNFLIFGGPGIGDTIIRIAVAKGLKKEFEDAKVDMLVSNALGSQKVICKLLECQDYIDNCYFYSKKAPFDAVKTIMHLRKNKYNYGIFCGTSFKSNSWPSKICKMIGAKSLIKKIEDKTGKIDLPVNIREDINIVEQYQILCKKIAPDIKLDIIVLDNKRIINNPIVFSCEKKKVVICVGTNITIYCNKKKKQVPVNIKEWDGTNWCKLSNALVERGYQVVLIGGKKDKDTIKNSSVQLDGRVLSQFLGETTINESLSILSQSVLVIGADTGMMHCAAALDKYTISLFGGTPAEVWRPYSNKNVVIQGMAECAPCYGKDYAMNCTYRKCMDSISCDNVVEKVEYVFRELL